MVLLGWMQDMHIHEDSTHSSPGADDEFQTDYDKLVDTYTVDDVYLTGDLVHGRPKGRRPHTLKADYDRFLSLLDGTTDAGGSMRAMIPGNHEVPLQTFLESDDRAVLRKRIDYDTAGVTVLLVNTTATGYVTGNSGSGSDNTGVGVTVNRLPYADVQWLDDQLSDAGSNAKLILPHAATYTTPSGATKGNGINGDLGPDSLYWVCTNYERIHSVISQYNKVVVPFSHLYQFGSGNETSATVDGVDYVSTQHYYDASADAATTFGRIDVDSSSCTITTEEHSDATEYTPLDVTF